MAPVAQVVPPGAALVAACVVAGCALTVLTVVLVRTSRRRNAELDAALRRSRDEVDALSRRLEELSDDVGRARRAAAEDREYVITSLGGPLQPRPDGTAPGIGPLDEPLRRSRPPVTGALEERLVERLADRPRTSPLQERGVALVVRAVALGHGLRRALSSDVLDRAAAEAHVARRRSRRDRRRQLRHARREAA